MTEKRKQSRLAATPASVHTAVLAATPVKSASPPRQHAQVVVTRIPTDGKPPAPPEVSQPIEVPREIKEERPVDADSSRMECSQAVESEYCSPAELPPFNRGSHLFQVSFVFERTNGVGNYAAALKTRLEGAGALHVRVFTLTDNPRTMVDMRIASANQKNVLAQIRQLVLHERGVSAKGLDVESIRVPELNSDIAIDLLDAHDDSRSGTDPQNSEYLLSVELVETKVAAGVANGASVAFNEMRIAVNLALEETAGALRVGYSKWTDTNGRDHFSIPVTLHAHSRGEAAHTGITVTHHALDVIGGMGIDKSLTNVNWVRASSK